MKNLEELIQMGQQLQSRMSQLQESLEAQSFTASAGGGMVSATVDGKGAVKKLQIDSVVVDPSDVEMLEDLVIAAVAEAQNKARAQYEEEIKKMTGGLPLPMQMPGLL